MITLLNKPYLCSFTKNPIDFKIQTDLQFDTATLYPELILSFKAKPVLGTTFNISFTNPENGRTETVNLVAVDGSNPLNYSEVWQIPDTSFSGTLFQLRNILLEKLRQTAIFNSYYDIKLPLVEFSLSVPTIIITAKEAIGELVMAWESNQPTAEINKYISEANSIAYHEPVVRDGYVLKASLFLEKNYLSGNFSLVTTILPVVDNESIAFVDVAKYIDAEIESSWDEYPLPYEQQKGYKSPNLRRYYLEFSEEFVNETEAPALTTEILYAHWGGASTNDAYNLNPVANQINSGQWLTWWPSGKRVLTAQSDWLAWMNGAETTTFNVNCVITTNANTYTITKHEAITLQPFETFVFNTGLEANDLQSDVGEGEEIAHWGWELAQGGGCTNEFARVTYTFEGEEYVDDIPKRGVLNGENCYDDGGNSLIFNGVEWDLSVAVANATSPDLETWSSGALTGISVEFVDLPSNCIIVNINGDAYTVYQVSDNSYYYISDITNANSIDISLNIGEMYVIGYGGANYYTLPSPLDPPISDEWIGEGLESVSTTACDCGGVLPIPSQFRYYPLDNCLAKQILFFNSFGIPESFLLSGEFQQNITTSQELAVRTESFALSNKLPQNYIFDSKNVISYSAETLMLSNLECERLMPLINSTITYLVEKNRFIPVILNAGTTAIFKVNSFLQKIQLELAQANESDRVSYYDVLPDFEPVTLYTVGIQSCTFQRNLLNITDFGNIKIYYEGSEIGTFTYNSFLKVYSGSAITQEGLLTFILTCEVNGETVSVKKQIIYKWDELLYEIVGTDADIRFSTFLSAETPMRIDWNDGTVEDVTIDGDGEQFLKTYPSAGKRFIRVFKPTFSDVDSFVVHNAVNQFDLSKFTLLETVLFDNCVGGNFYFVGLKQLKEVAFLNTTVHKLNIGFQRELEDLILAFTNISESNFENLIREIWTFRKAYKNGFLITITDEVEVSSVAQAIIDGTGFYAGDGLNDYGITLSII